MDKKILFEELKPQELTGIINNSGIIYLPLGTLEWHERHLPFGVDAYISNEICRRACMKTDGCVIPPLYFGTDREHQIKGKVFHGMDSKAERILPGSIYYLKQDLFCKFLKQIVFNIAQQGFKKLVIVSGHSGTAQQQVLEKIAIMKVGKLQIITFPGRSFEGGIDHAAMIETRLMLAIKPELVDMSKLEEPFEAISGENPHKATVIKGKRQLERIVKQVVDRVNCR